jgi:RNA 2',3'-cyclic 3'-phosphodiesterase
LADDNFWNQPLPTLTRCYSALAVAAPGLDNPRYLRVGAAAAPAWRGSECWRKAAAALVASPAVGSGPFVLPPQNSGSLPGGESHRPHVIGTRLSRVGVLSRGPALLASPGADAPGWDVMRLDAAVLPPPEAQYELAKVVHAAPGAPQQFQLEPPDHLRVHLANFGSVTQADAEDLRQVLAKELAAWSPLLLRFHAGTALDRPSDDSIWASLVGDVEQLAQLGRHIARVVHRLGFLIDRRTFRTQVRVARITQDTTADFLQDLLDRLDAYHGSEWTAEDVTLLQPRASGPDAPPRFTRLYEVPLGAREGATDRRDL